MIPPTSQASAERHQSQVTDIKPHQPRPLFPAIPSARPTLALVPLVDKTEVTGVPTPHRDLHDAKRSNVVTYYVLASAQK